MSVRLSAGSIPPAGPHLTVPFTIIVDTREQIPYSFTGFEADHEDAKRYRPKNMTIKAATGLPLYVPTATDTLLTGDYSVRGMAALATIERKSLADLYGSLGAGRDRFEREHERMSHMVFAAVVIDAGWQEIFSNPPPQSKLSPKSVHRTMCSWQQRYGVSWLAMGDRRLAEITTFRILEKFWREENGVS